LQIGDAEAKVHGIGAKADIRLHELGDIDSIVDIVGAAIAIDALKIDEIYSSPVNFGRAILNTKGGVLPAPSPASLELLKGSPVSVSAVEAELVTPTGAGILKTLAKLFGACPEMRIGRVGYGAGTKEFDGMPNMLRVVIGEKGPPAAAGRIVAVETNIDDMNPQHFEYLFERLFKEGALDVYTTNIQMKKSRPAFKLTVLAEPASLERLSKIIFSETTSIGLRFQEWNRYKLDRKIVKVRTRYGAVRVKVSCGSARDITISPEYDDCARLARAKKIPLRKIYDEAKAKINS